MNFAIFWYILVCGIDITWSKQFKPWKLSTVVTSIMIFGVLTHCILLHSVYDLKAIQMNVQCCLIWKLMLYEFKLSHNTAGTTKNTCAKGEDALDHCTITKRFKKFPSDCKNITNQARWGRPKTMDSEAEKQIWRVELKEYQANSISHC